MAAESRKKMEDAGVEIITDIDKQPFIDAMAPVYEKYAATSVPGSRGFRLFSKLNSLP